MTLRTRLTLTTVAVAMVAVAVVALVGTALVTAYLRQSAVDDLSRQARAASQAIDVARGGATDRPASAEERVALGIERALARAGIDGAIVNDARPSRLVTQVLTPAERDRIAAGQEVRGSATVDGREVIFAATPGPPAVVVVRPIASVRAALGAVARRLLGTGFLAVLVGGAVGYGLGGRIARPIRDVERTVARVGRGELDHVPPGHVLGRPDEVGDLGRGVAAMTLALREARDDQRGFFRNVAHELRTPLTNIRGYTEGLMDGHFADETSRRDALGVVHDEAERLERFVEDVMTLARLDAGDFTVDPSVGDLGDVVRSAAAAAGPIAAAAGVEIVDDAAAVVVETDPDRVRQVLDNLLANALRVTPSGGRITVAVRGSGRGARLTVADTGPGIRAEDVPHAFERYELWRRYRGEREVGTGLGLAIVAGLVRRLGGTVALDGGGDGRGASFTVDLPSEPPRTLPT